jgi:hypothetical protein
MGKRTENKCQSLEEVENRERRLKYAILPIFVVTTLYVAEKWLREKERRFLAPTNQRTVAFFFNKEDAIKCVTQNWGDIYECGSYNLALIEETWQGLYPHIEKEIWFKWDKKKNGYFEIKKPSVFKNVISFGIG